MKLSALQEIYDKEMDQGKDTISYVPINYGKDEWALVEGSTEAANLHGGNADKTSYKPPGS